ncbi:hypothetical protein EV361DRAFT_979219, partial [Lentinula raphanica]
GGFLPSDESSDKENDERESGSYIQGSGSDSQTPSGPLSGTRPSETGYNICRSSDLSKLTCRSTYTLTASWSTPTPTDPTSPSLDSDKGFSSDSKKFVTASQGSSDYITARIPSSETSFQSLPSIPSEYTTTKEGSAYDRIQLVESEESRSAPPSAPPSEAPSQVPSIVSSSTASLPPPSSMAPSSVTERTVSPPSSVSSLGPSGFPLPSSAASELSDPQPWATETNISNQSSLLAPSPGSATSVALIQNPDISLETSFLRPSGSWSSFDLISTIPETLTVTTSAPSPSFQALSPVPPLPPTSVRTPISLVF